MDNHFDVIIIGSGMSGLTCASLLARLEQKKVLILERHFTPGGFTHSFKRKNQYAWDVGVHYVGEMNPGSHYRALFDYVTAGALDWRAMPERFDRFVYPDLSFDARCGIHRFRQDLIDRFPEERAALEQYFKDLITGARWYGRLMIARLLPDWLRPVSGALTRINRKLAMMTTQAYLDRQFRDEKLKAVLASQWGNAGIPPGLSAFAVHAVIACHYLDGGYYPVGGARKIADSIVPLVEAADGQLLTRHRAERIILEGDRAVGVEAVTRAHGQTITKQFYADRIISCAGAHVTFSQLIPKAFPLPFRDELERFPPGSFHVCAYLGFKDTPASLGFRGENLWIYDDYRHDELYARRGNVLKGEVSGCFLSFPSLKDPMTHGHTAEIIAFVDQESFQQWAQQPWGKRGDEYDALKQRIAEGLIGFVDRRFPGFAELVDYCELSTPLSTANFTGHKNGCIYGLPGIPEKLSASWLSPRTPVRNLYLTGADVTGQGIVGALMGGILTTLTASNRPWPLLKLLLSSMRLAKHPEKRDVLKEAQLRAAP